MIRRAFVILLGLLLVVLITPLTQFLSIKAANVVTETESPVGWAVGILAGLVLSVLAVRLLGRWSFLRRSDLVILYAMLAISVPLMNLGLPRLFFMANQSILREYMLEGTHTYRTAYNALDDDWFPMVPTLEGLAWTEAERTLRILQSAEQQNARSEAERTLVLHFAAGETPDASGLKALERAAGLLGADEADAVLQSIAEIPPGSEALVARIEERRTTALAESDAALETLRTLLPTVRETTVAFLPETLDKLDYSSRQRVESIRQALSAVEAAALEEGIAAFLAVEGEVRTAIDRIKREHFNTLVTELAASSEERLLLLPREAFQEERRSFVYRLSRDERRRILRMSGEDGGPNQNLWAFQFSLWDTTALRQEKERNSFWQNFSTLREQLPWHLWWKPLLNWYVLFVLFFLFFAFLAEWLRRKWVDRENLPFPVVEVVDNLIRHDQRLEHAADVHAPEPRKKLFNPFFLIGLGLGFALLTIEALNHYEIWSNNLILYFDLTTNVFDPAGSAMRELQKVIFVLSPIVVGITFLLSLETSFSIWVSYLVYVAVTWWIKLALGDASDSMYTGFANGKLYPFPMEQLLGAVICFAIFLVIKAWPRGGDSGTGPDPYLPPRLTRFGLILLPPVLIAMLYSAGISHLPLLIVFFILVVTLAIASARVRAETGLPQAHMTYESTKLPIVLGMTEWTGAKVFAAFTSIVFLPATLLIRSLGQQIENIELARRNSVSYKTVGVASVLAVVVTIAVGMVSFLMFAYFLGRDFFAESALAPQSAMISSPKLATYPLWVSHFLGEPGLDNFNQLNLLRVGMIAIGFAVVAALLFMRRRFMRFPIAPVGYIVVLLSFQFQWASPYLRHDLASWEASLIWGGVFVGWLIKKLVVKYGGMNVYRSAKPLFIGLVAGSVLTVFGWNLLDLVISLQSAGTADPLPAFKPFIDNTPFNPLVY